MQYSQYCAHSLPGRVGGMAEIGPQTQQHAEGGACSGRGLERVM